MLRKIQALQLEKDESLATVIDLEREVKKLKDENLTFKSENLTLKDSQNKLRSDEEVAR